MTARTAGHLLLALALLGAAGVVVLGLVSGVLDRGLAAIAVVLVGAATVPVVVDRRRAAR